jgi:hypothetical protein
MVHEEARRNRRSQAGPALAATLAVALLAVSTIGGCAFWRPAEPATKPDPFAATQIPAYDVRNGPANANASPAPLVVRRLPPVPVRLAAGEISLMSLVVEAQPDDDAPSGVVPIPMHSELEIVPQGPSLPARHPRRHWRPRRYQSRSRRRTTASRLSSIWRRLCV